MSDNLNIFGTTYSNVTGIKATDTNNVVQTFIKPSGTKSITANGTGIDVTEYASVDVSVSPTIEALTVTPTTSQQVFNNANVDGYKPVTVNAMPSGTAGTPTATKGTVSNHSVSVTPSVTNTTGYITGGTTSGTAVTVSASELVSGSETKTANGTYDVTNLAELIVSVSGGGGATNFKTGTFTTPSETGATNISIPYTGTGYPIMIVVVVETGMYHSGTDWYNSVQRYAVGQWTCTKSNFTTSPTYTTSGSANQGVVVSIYKNSTSTATSYTNTSSMNANVFSSSDASNSATNAIRYKSGNVLSYYTNTSKYGLHPNTVYRYFIAYSE